MKKAFLFLLVAFNSVFSHGPAESTSGYEVRLHSAAQDKVTYGLWYDGDTLGWLFLGPQKKATFTGIFEGKGKDVFFVVTHVKINSTPFNVEKHVPIFASLLRSSIRINGMDCVYGGKEKSD